MFHGVSHLSETTHSDAPTGEIWHEIQQRHFGRIGIGMRTPWAGDDSGGCRGTGFARVRDAPIETIGVNALRGSPALHERIRRIGEIPRRCAHSG
jgi:hypothetical protein